MKFGPSIDLDNISDEFEGQGHRSKLKVIQLKNFIFRVLAWVFSMINGIKISCVYVGRISRMRTKILRMRLRNIIELYRDYSFHTREVQQHFSVFVSYNHPWSDIGILIS